MNDFSYKLGLWSARIFAITFLVWVISFVGIAAATPLFFWEDLTGFIEYRASNPPFFQHLAFSFMLICGPVYVIMIGSYYAYAEKGRKILVLLASQFALAFAILSSINYFVQLTVVRANLNAGNYDGLQHLVQANPDSVMTASVMLGWTVFLGLSSILMFPVFSGNRRNKVLRYSFLINGLSCFLAGIGYVFKIDILTFFFTNIVTGGMLIIIAVFSARFFRSQKV